MRRLLILCIFLGMANTSRQLTAGTPSPPPRHTSYLKGRTLNIHDNQPVGFVNILLQEIGRSVQSDANGEFLLIELPAGEFTLKTFRIGYKNITQPIRLTKSDTTELTLPLHPAPVHLGGVIIESRRDAEGSPVQADFVFSDKKLHQNLGQTVAETIDYEPGISQRSMGPAPARPVLRGLGGDRLLVLEDNQNTGDLSATSADHAVAIETMTTERIEVIRGPEALVYGSNPLGGVVNVIRHAIPSQTVAKVTGSAGFQGETVNRGAAGGIELKLPVGPATARIDGSYRRARDIHTPLGPLINTDIHTRNGSAALSWVKDWGYIGVSSDVYESSYGIPPDANGGHPSGVDINLDRTGHNLRGEIFTPAPGISRLDINYNHNRYYHKELEATGALGLEFGIVSDEIRIFTHLEKNGPLQNGIVGFYLNRRDFASGGLTFTPNTLERSAALFVYQAAQWKTFGVHGSLRFDAHSVQPRQERWSRRVGEIRRREFQGVSASMSPHWQVHERLEVFTAWMRTFRSPNTEELFSEGPHLAAYSYEIGNANLRDERGNGYELGFKYKWGRTDLHGALFFNDIENYTFPRNTGERSWRRNDLFMYQYTNEHVHMWGGEVSFHLPLSCCFHAAGTISYVRGSLVDGGALPYMPPLESKLNIVYEIDGLNVSVSFRGADAQTRVGEFEQSTAGYGVMDVQAQYLISTNRHLHSLSLTLQNAANAEYRKHLNRVRDVMPEPGRNVRLLYKIFI